MKTVKILLLLVLCVIAAIISGCSKEGKSKEIEFLTGRTDLVNGVPDSTGKKDPETAYFKILAQKFEKETGIKVKISAYPDYDSACRSRFASGNYGDVIQLGLQMSNKKKEMLFKPLGTKKEFSNYLFLNKCSVGDNVYGLAEGCYVSGVVYNKKVFADAGYTEFPKTLKELDAAFAKIKTNEKIPLILDRGDGWPLNYIMALAGNFSGSTSVYNKLWMDNNPFGKGKPMGEAFNTVARWVNKSYTEPEFIKMWEDSKSLVAGGKAGMMITQSWLLPQIKTRAKAVGTPPENIEFAAFPACIPYQDKQYTFADAGLPFVISKNTKNYEASKKWIFYIINSGIFKTQGALPIKKDSEDVDPGILPMLKQINSNEIIKLDAIPADAYNGHNTDTILKDMNVYTDYKYLGNALDRAKVSLKDYNEYIKYLNTEFNKIRKDRGY